MRSGGLLQRGMAALAAALVAAPGLARATDGVAPETAVKAAYLSKFAPFVTWPQLARAPPDAPLTICVQGADPFDGVLDRLTAGERVGRHPVIVRRIAKLGADSGCQIAYVGGSPKQPQAAALAAVEGEPVLTVTDSDSGGDRRGIVHLILSGGHVRFIIDAGQADRDGLRISSKLLALSAGARR
ncbi:MAG TPA: YfiR family protein [Caulobacteraceae bacterium]|nr:YfiR family protein [Caulobacteraceae bacterium]